MATCSDTSDRQVDVGWIDLCGYRVEFVSNVQLTRSDHPLARGRQREDQQVCNLRNDDDSIVVVKSRRWRNNSRGQQGAMKDPQVYACIGHGRNPIVVTDAERRARFAMQNLDEEVSSTPLLSCRSANGSRFVAEGPGP